MANQELEAVFFYGGILDAYEAVGKELIGPDVLDEHVLPRMIYYVKEFLPEIFSEKGDESDLVSDLKEFLERYHTKINAAVERTSANDFTMEEIWQLRAAIFGYESVFIDILGETAIKNYVFKRMADILSAYLPEDFFGRNLTLNEKLVAYAKYIKNKKFVGYAQAKVKGNQVIVTTNRCAFSQIHNSDAYRNAETRFCPWAMIGSAIVASHEGRETSIDSCQFTTLGSISNLSVK